MTSETIGETRENESLQDDIFNGLELDLQMDDVCFSYDKKDESKAVLKGITLEINGPQLISIVGPNGVGKSTLIHCINKILNPVKGKVMINQTDVRDINVKELAKDVGYVPYTSSDSFPLSVVDTVMMGRFPHSKWGSSAKDLEIVKGVLKLLDIEDLALRSFSELSAGQHQKVMLARGLAQEPKILLLDEPTSNLDIRYQLEITRILRDLSHQKRMIVIMISHDINIAAKYSDNIIMLKNGTIYSLGEPKDVITEENVRYVYDIGCRIVMDEDRPHVILIDEKDKSCIPSDDHYIKGVCH